MMKYIKYFFYILEHKWNVFKCCWKRGLYLHAFTHDLSKFLPDEFFPYANWFYGKYGKKLKDIDMVIYNMNFPSLQKKLHYDIHKKNKLAFEKAWSKHYHRNKHHWNYWYRTFKWKSDNYYITDKKYILQMICDWEAMGLKFGDTAKEYYQKNKEKINLHPDSRKILETILFYKY